MQSFKMRQAGGAATPNFDLHASLPRRKISTGMQASSRLSGRAADLPFAA
jgi:hypothetical protein